jgi:hypothetical protein
MSDQQFAADAGYVHRDLGRSEIFAEDVIPRFLKRFDSFSTPGRWRYDEEANHDDHAS